MMRIYCLLLAVILSLLTSVASADDNLAMVQKMITEVKARVPKIDTQTLKRMIDKNENFVLLDVRLPNEIESMGKIAARQQVEIPRRHLEMQIFNHVVDKSEPIMVYCGSGWRSAFATETLKQMGFTNVRNYEEGLLTWKEKGYPVK